MNSKSDTELLQELVKDQKAAARNSKIIMICLAILTTAITIALLIIVPMAVRTIKSIDATITEVNDTIDMAEKSIDDIDKMVKNVDDLVVTNTESVNKSISYIENIDFDSLNQSIQDFSDVIQPLADFVNKFK